MMQPTTTGTTIEACRADIKRLCSDISTIQGQLHRRRKPRDGSSDLDIQRYYAWRKKAVSALEWKQEALGALKSKRLELLTAQSHIQLDTTSDLILLRQLHTLTKHLIQQGAVPTQEEQTTLDTIQEWLRSQ